MRKIPRFAFPRLARSCTPTSAPTPPAGFLTFDERGLTPDLQLLGERACALVGGREPRDGRARHPDRAGESEQQQHEQRHDDRPAPFEHREPALLRFAERRLLGELLVRAFELGDPCVSVGHAAPL